MNILHISDIHFRREYPHAESGYPSIFNTMTNPTSMLSECIDRARATHELDLVVITGDLTENGDAEDYVVLKACLDQKLAGTPYVITPGNHDTKSEFWRGWLGVEGCEARYSYVFDADELAVVSLDSSDGTANGSIDEDQVRWLRCALDDLGDKPALLITHHHFFDEQGVVPPVPRAEGFDEALTHGNVMGILNGHTHHTFTAEYRGIPYFTANSLSFAGIDQQGGVRFEEMYGYNLYEVEGGEFVYQRIETFSPRKVLGVLTF